MNEYRRYLCSKSAMRKSGKASKDRQAWLFSRNNKENYTWDKPHFKGRIVQCKTEEAYEAAKGFSIHSRRLYHKYLRHLNDSVVNVKSTKACMWKEIISL